MSTDTGTDPTTFHTGHEPPLDRLVRLMLTNLALGVLVGGSTLLFHDRIVGHVLAHSASGRDQVSATLWSRPGPAVAVAILYPLFIRRLRQHQRRGYRRTVIVAVLQLASLVWFSAAPDYPPWLRILMAVQAVVVMGVLWSATRPAVRALFGYTGAAAATKHVRHAVLTLVVLAPLVAELTWGSTRASQIVGLALYWPAYGAGALLVREVVHRTGRGWASVLVLGVVYGLLEEGLALQSLTSPTLFPSMSALAPRVAGVNPAYTLMVLTYHALFSIAIPIALTDLVHPGARREPWLGRRGLVVTGVVALLGMGLLRLIPTSVDPDYLLPVLPALVLGVLVIALVVVALVAVPVPPGSRTDRALPAPASVGIAASAATLVFLGLLMPLPGADHAGYAPTSETAWVAIVAASVVLGTAVAAARLRSGAAGWTDLHTTAVIAGALVAHTVIGLLTLVHTALDRVALAGFGVVEVLLLAWLVRRVRD